MLLIGTIVSDCIVLIIACQEQPQYFLDARFRFFDKQRFPLVLEVIFFEVSLLHFLLRSQLRIQFYNCRLEKIASRC